MLFVFGLWPSRDHTKIDQPAFSLCINSFGTYFDSLGRCFVFLWWLSIFSVLFFYLFCFIPLLRIFGISGIICFGCIWDLGLSDIHTIMGS